MQLDLFEARVTLYLCAGLVKYCKEQKKPRAHVYETKCLLLATAPEDLYGY